jgi:hypothetical protein
VEHLKTRGASLIHRNLRGQSIADVAAPTLRTGYASDLRGAQGEEVRSSNYVPRTEFYMREGQQESRRLQTELQQQRDSAPLPTQAQAQKQKKKKGGVPAPPSAVEVASSLRHEQELLALLEAEEEAEAGKPSGKKKSGKKKK